MDKDKENPRMPVAKKAAAPVRKTTRSSATAVPAGPDPMYVRDRAVAIARSLFGEGPISGDPIVSASKLVTQARRIETYLLGNDVAGDDV